MEVRTVDWSGWLTAKSAEQDEMRRRYREIIKSESDGARFSNYRRMNEALDGLLPSAKSRV